MDQFTAIRVSAFRTVLKPDREYLIKKILRWYSKTFVTPIADVEDMPLEDVIQAYYEEKYEAMDADDREAERLELIKSEEQRQQEMLAEDREEAELFEMGRIVAAEEAKKKAKAKPGDKTQEQIAPVQHQRGLLKPMMAESELPFKPPEVPPAVEVKFITEEDLEAEIAAFEAMADKKP